MSTKTQSRTASRFSAKTLTMCAIFTALVAVCSQITIPLPLIPINLALFAVYLAGALLGPWRGALSLLVYLLLAAVGVPVMAGFRGGLGNLVGNTGGYVVGYIFAAFFTGLLVEKWGARFWQMCVAMLLDCGEGTQTAARRAGVNLMRADAICLTHYHGDHIFGLPGLLQTLGAQGRTRPLVLLGPEGLLEVWRAVCALTGPLPYAVKPLVCRAGQPVALDALSDGWPAGATLLPVATKHRVRSLGYRLDLPRAGRFDPEKARALGVPVTQWRLLQRGQAVPLAERMVQPAEVLGAPRKGLRFVFSGDSAPCPALEQAAQGADLLLCDATYALPEQQEQAAQWGHSTFGQSAALAAKADVKRMWLGHYSPMITDPEQQLAQAQSIFPAAECGFDGKRITLHYEENEE